MNTPLTPEQYEKIRDRYWSLVKVTSRMETFNPKEIRYSLTKPIHFGNPNYSYEQSTWYELNKVSNYRHRKLSI